MSPEYYPLNPRQQNKALSLLRAILAEWDSDPRSVQCFDLRIVNGVRELIKSVDLFE